MALNGLGLTDLVLDSISELGSAYLDAYEVEHEALCAKEKWASWRAWRKKYPQIERYLTTDVLHANVVWTAHTREVKETAVSSSGKELKGYSLTNETSEKEYRLVLLTRDCFNRLLNMVRSETEAHE